MALKGRVRGTVVLLTGRARQLRQSETPAEEIAWNLLPDRRAFGLMFRRQQPLGNYVVDFYCHELRLIVELDGEVHSQPSRVKRDARRKASLERLGCRLRCVPNGLVLQDPDAFLAKIGNYIPSPGLRPPSPRGRGRSPKGSQ
ncbi:MAG: endonuclease domain-containing protein [Terriglobia bacterium]